MRFCNVYNHLFTVGSHINSRLLFRTPFAAPRSHRLGQSPAKCITSHRLIYVKGHKELHTPQKLRHLSAGSPGFQPLERGKSGLPSP